MATVAGVGSALGRLCPYAGPRLAILAGRLVVDGRGELQASLARYPAAR